MVPEILAAAAIVISGPHDPQLDYAQVSAGQSRRGCPKVWRSKVAYRRTTRLLRNHRPLTPETKHKVGRYARCVASSAKQRSVRRHVGRLRAWRMSYPHRWPIVFNRLPSWDRAWAYSTSSCESGMNPATNTGNGFYGAFQFLVSTWHAAGGTGYPHQHSWHYQAVIAVRWMHVAGAGQWPVCGR